MCERDGKVTWPAWALLILSACGGCEGDSRVDEVPLSKQFEQALQRTYPESRAAQLIQVALRQGRARDMAGAKRSLEAATRACAEIPDALGRHHHVPAGRRAGTPGNAKRGPRHPA